MQLLNTVVSKMITLPFNIKFDLCLFSHVIGINWKWVWVDSRSWWWTGRPGVLRFMESRRVGHDWATALSWTEELVNAKGSLGWVRHSPGPQRSWHEPHQLAIPGNPCFLLWGSNSTCPVVLPSPCQAHLARSWHWRRRYFPSSGIAETCFSPAFWKWSWLHCV